MHHFTRLFPGHIVETSAHSIGIVTETFRSTLALVYLDGVIVPALMSELTRLEDPSGGGI